MKLKVHSSKLFYSIALLLLLASCSTNNKVVSSFGKRKYTKGYYFNFRSHKRPELPIIATNKGSKANNQTVENKWSLVPLNDKPPAFTSPSKNNSNQVKQNKINLSGISRFITGKTRYILPKNNTQHISAYPQSITDYGVPGHQVITDDTSRNKYDGVATTAFILAMLSFLLLWADGLGILLIVPAFICSIIGLKSKRRHTQAVVGLVISTIELLVIIAAIIILVELIDDGQL